MFRRSFSLGFFLLLGVLHCQAVLALGAKDACSWKASFIATGSMSAPRAGHAATVLLDRRVLISGGSTPVNAVNVGEIFSPATGLFVPTQNLISPRYFHTATLLDSGKVLVAGGSIGGGSAGALASAEIFDPASNGFAATGSLLKARVDHSATLLGDGKVLLVGGSGVAGGSSTGPVAELELFDPASGTFSVVGNLATPRSHHTATRLTGSPAGIDEVLIVGGNGPFSATDNVEILSYNRATRTVSTRAAPSLASARQDHAATLLADGSVLVTGGADRNYQPVAAVERWNRTVVAPAGVLSHPRMNHFATLLPTGQVLVAGGLDTQAVAPTELYTPGAGFKDAGNMVTPRFYAVAAPLPNGQVLYAGGFDASFLNQVAGAEIYDPFWAGVGPMNEGRSSHSSTLLVDGRVLLAGGGDGMGAARGSAELFDPATMSFTRVAMQGAREKHSATLLTSGDVLLTGGQNGTGHFLSASEIFNPAANNFSGTAALSVPRLDHTATLLSDGRVLVTGGFSPTPQRTTEFFSWNAVSRQGTFAAGPDMTRDRRGHAAVRVSNGRVLVSGGWSDLVSGITYAVEEFDPVANAFSAFPNSSWMVTNRKDHRMAAVGGQASALVVGGLTSGITPTKSFETVPAGSQGQTQQARFHHAMTEIGRGASAFWVIGGQDTYSGNPLATVESLDPTNLGMTNVVPELGTGRANHTATLLADGRVLVAGGTRTMDGTTPTAEISKSTVCRLIAVHPRPGRFSFEKVYLRIEPKAVALRALVGNAGRVNNPASTIRYDVVARDGSDLRVAAGEMRVPKLGPGEKVRLSSRFDIPARLPKGAYGIQACLPPQSGVAGQCFDTTGRIEVAGLKSASVMQFPFLGESRK